MKSLLFFIEYNVAAKDSWKLALAIVIYCYLVKPPILN